MGYRYHSVSQPLQPQGIRYHSASSHNVARLWQISSVKARSYRRDWTELINWNVFQFSAIRGCGSVFIVFVPKKQNSEDKRHKFYKFSSISVTKRMQIHAY